MIHGERSLQASSAQQHVDVAAVLQTQLLSQVVEGVHHLVSVGGQSREYYRSFEGVEDAQEGVVLDLLGERTVWLRWRMDGYREPYRTVESLQLGAAPVRSDEIDFASSGLVLRPPGPEVSRMYAPPTTVTRLAAGWTGTEAPGLLSVWSVRLVLDEAEHVTVALGAVDNQGGLVVQFAPDNIVLMTSLSVAEEYVVPAGLTSATGRLLPTLSQSSETRP